jgi:hypothetical protein
MKHIAQFPFLQIHVRSIVANHAFGPPGLNFGPSFGGIESN